MLVLRIAHTLIFSSHSERPGIRVAYKVMHHLRTFEKGLLSQRLPILTTSSESRRLYPPPFFFPQQSQLPGIAPLPQYAYIT